MNTIPYTHPAAPLLIRNQLFSCIPADAQKITIVCIGSNRINGDSLGPFVGTFLQGMFPEHLTIIGNLQRPVDAVRLPETVDDLDLYANSIIIAVDSIIGTKEHVHTVVVRNGPLHPGSGLGKTLPAIGDISIMGVVMEEEENPFHSLSYTNLHVIYQMARSIATGIALAVRQRFGYESNAALLSTL